MMRPRNGEAAHLEAGRHRGTPRDRARFIYSSSFFLAAPLTAGSLNKSRPRSHPHHSSHWSLLPGPALLLRAAGDRR
jgi:hypothetical protein